MYAFNPNTWRLGPVGPVVDAAWFRRKKGRLLAAMGSYQPWVLRHDQAPPDDAPYEVWVAAADDNRYGGSHLASWDGEALLCTDPPAVPPEVAAQRIAFLSVMLAGFPAVPGGFDGWWTFPSGR